MESNVKEKAWILLQAKWFDNKLLQEHDNNDQLRLSTAQLVLLPVKN